MDDIVSSEGGEKVIFYILAIAIFAGAMVFISIFLFSARQEKIVVPDEFKDARDFYGFSRHCSQSIVWEELSNDWFDDCVKFANTPQTRAYRFTFKVGSVEKVAVTNNWNDKVAEKRIAKPVRVIVNKEGKDVYADLFWEAQHASFII